MSCSLRVRLSLSQKSLEPSFFFWITYITHRNYDLSIGYIKPLVTLTASLFKVISRVNCFGLEILRLKSCFDFLLTTEDSNQIYSKHYTKNRELCTMNHSL